jgi:hypothetical protein
MFFNPNTHRGIAFCKACFSKQQIDELKPSFVKKIEPEIIEEEVVEVEEIVEVPEQVRDRVKVRVRV